MCYFSDYSLALFVLKYTAGTYFTADTPIDATHNANSYHHNRCLIQYDNEQPVYVIRDGDQMIRVDDTFAMATKNDSGLWQMYLSAAEHQLAFCSLTQAYARLAAANA